MKEIIDSLWEVPAEELFAYLDAVFLRMFFGLLGVLILFLLILVGFTAFGRYRDNQREKRREKQRSMK